MSLSPYGRPIFYLAEFRHNTVSGRCAFTTKAVAMEWVVQQLELSGGSGSATVTEIEVASTIEAT